MPNPIRTGRAGGWTALAWIWVAILGANLLAPLTWAQDEGKKAETPAATATETATPSAEPEPTAAPTSAPAETPAEPKEVKSMLMWAIEASGFIGLFIVGLSIYFFALVFKLFMEYRLSEAVPAALVEKVDGLIKERKIQDAYDACKESESFLAKVVRAGIASLPNGKAESKEAMSDMSEELVTGMDARISYLATIGTLGPMIGLVGTIWGMILSFRELATTTGSQPRPEKLAEGISTALFITLEGVSLSVPAIFFFAFFRNRIALIAVDAQRTADRIIASIISAAKQAKTSA